MTHYDFITQIQGSAVDLCSLEDRGIIIVTAACHVWLPWLTSLRYQ